MPKPEPVSQRLLRVRDAARYVALSPWKLRKLVQDGQLPIVKYVENSPWLIDVRDLDGWVEHHKQII
jgi:excisionase family DNA binding protein